MQTDRQANRQTDREKACQSSRHLDKQPDMLSAAYVHVGYVHK